MTSQWGRDRRDMIIVMFSQLPNLLWSLSPLWETRDDKSKLGGGLEYR